MDVRKRIRKIIEEILGEEYPETFSFQQLEDIGSYAGKLRYAETHLQKLASGSARVVYKVDDTKVDDTTVAETMVTETMVTETMVDEIPAVESNVERVDETRRIDDNGTRRTEVAPIVEVEEEEVAEVETKKTSDAPDPEKQELREELERTKQMVKELQAMFVDIRKTFGNL
jgi:mRNA-degrading endonuclease RelE of RelBE toxin-antitoxin system